nr:hypothetical protein [Tanacetum cinerariifolium]
MDITLLKQPDRPPTAPKANRGKGKVIDDVKSLKKLVKASSKVHPDPDEPVRIPYEIHGKLYHLTNDEIQEHLDKEKMMKKATKEAKVLEMSKPELIKKFKKIHDAEIKVLNREHSQKIKKEKELRNKRINQYMWTSTSRLKPKPITDVKIYPNTKPVVITVYRGTNRRNFEAHNPFKFGDFRVIDLDNLEVFSQVKTYFWEEPYAFKLFMENIMRRCVAGSETLKILAHCHSGPTGGHHSANVTAKKVYDFRFYWPSVFKDDNKLEEACTETIKERCSAVLLNKLPLEENDPTRFIIHCQVLEKHKETEDLAAYHLSRFEIPHMEVLTEKKITDKFFDKQLMVLKSKFNNDEPWYAYFINYIVGKEPYVFKLCADNIMRRCVAGSETLEILAHCHSGPTGGHHSANVTAKKVYESKFYCPSVFKDANKQTKVINMAIKRTLERSVGYNPKDWSEKLNDALWAFRTAYKTLTGCTPFRLVYGKACHLPVEIKHKAHWVLKQCNIDLTLASESHLMQLNELAELRDGSYENIRIYKERTKKWHESRLHGVKIFKVGDKPYEATVIIDKNGFNFKVNGQRLKKYYEGDIDKEDDGVTEFENGVT